MTFTSSDVWVFSFVLESIRPTHDFRPVSSSNFLSRKNRIYGMYDSKPSTLLRTCSNKFLEKSPSCRTQSFAHRYVQDDNGIPGYLVRSFRPICCLYSLLRDDRNARDRSRACTYCILTAIMATPTSSCSFFTGQKA